MWMQDLIREQQEMMNYCKFFNHWDKKSRNIQVAFKIISTSVAAKFGVKCS